MSLIAGNKDNVTAYMLGQAAGGPSALDPLPLNTTITYSFAAGWTPSEVATVAAAFQEWSFLTGIKFDAVPQGGMVTFQKNTNKAAYQQTTSTDANGRMATATISVDTLPDHGFGAIEAVGSYGFSTIVHEIGHLMGLDHPGGYNGDTATLDSGFKAGSVFTTDSEMYSIMSYNDATATGGSNVTPSGEVYASTPMQYDIYAVQQLYGVHPAAADLVFGFNSNTGIAAYTFTASSTPVVTIENGGAAGGVLDLSGFSAAMTVSLVPGSFSDVAGLTKNLSIGYDTILTKVIGGSGSNVITGNDAGDTIVASGTSNTITGGAGNDTIVLGSGVNTVNGGGGANAVKYAIGLRSSSHTAMQGGTETVMHNGNTDALTNVGEVDFVDGTLTYDPHSTAAAVDRLYLAGLGRTADQAGLDYWTGIVSGGGSIGSVAMSFIGSQEFTARYGNALGNGDFIDRLYANQLGRAADASGRAYWTNLLDQGTSRATVLTSFSQSDESIAVDTADTSRGLWVDSQTADEVARLYDTLLSRAADLNGLASWRQVLDTGHTTLAQIADSFIGSAEYQQSYAGLGNAAYVQDLYQNALHRTADASGLASWTAALNAGQSRGMVAAAISESAEHLTLTASTIAGAANAQAGIQFAGPASTFTSDGAGFSMVLAPASALAVVVPSA